MPLLALIVGQVCLHACMAGVRVAAPLAALAAGHSALAVGVLLSLFAAGPIVFALQAGRLADRHGYHRPLRLAVALCVAGGRWRARRSTTWRCAPPRCCAASAPTSA